ncbi:DUF302 domain-containing protein [Winogradskyella immobilis]|nr:DUF302 domain-containing protein [Winogradskyella immobilis]
MKYRFAFISLMIITLTSCNTKNMDTNNGLIIKESPYDFDTTYTKLRSIIDTNPNLKIILELDHSRNAASVDLNLNPTRIILFGNPKLGTPLMQTSQTVSIDLPQKIIVYVNDSGNVNIAYNDPSYLKSRHQIEGKDDILAKVSGALNAITDKVISAE